MWFSKILTHEIFILDDVSLNTKKQYHECCIFRNFYWEEYFYKIMKHLILLMFILRSTTSLSIHNNIQLVESLRF